MLCINCSMVLFQLDNGAATNSMSRRLHRTMTKDRQLTGLKKTDKRLRMYKETEVKPFGERYTE